MPLTPTQKLEHEALQRDIHKIDDIAEKHTNIVIIILAAMFAYVFTSASGPAIILTSILGLIISFEWLCKMFRHRSIYRYAFRRMAALEKRIGINTRRVSFRIKEFPYTDGLTILIYLSAIFMVFWLIVIIMAMNGLI